MNKTLITIIVILGVVSIGYALTLSQSIEATKDLPKTIVLDTRSVNELFSTIDEQEEVLKILEEKEINTTIKGNLVVTGNLFVEGCIYYNGGVLGKCK